MTHMLSRLAMAASLLALLACGGKADTEMSEAKSASAETAADQETQDAASSETASEPELVQAPEGSRAAEDMAIGSPDAPLTIIEYASVTCPHCATFHKETFPQIKERFIDTGQVRFVYREFPTAPVRLAQAGFIVARCAATDSGPEGYFAMIDALYKTQQSWMFSQEPGAELRNIAAQAGIDDEGFQTCFAREDIRDVIVASIEQGRDDGVSATPSLAVDGKTLDIGRTPDDAIAAIEAELEKRS
ncbi:MAG: DsbA family protein [Pseudomonadota bacterium]